MGFQNVFQKYRNELIATVAATQSIFMVIMCSSWSSPALPKLLAADSPIPITADEGSWIVAFQPVGAIFGPIFSSVAMDRIGRKWTLLSTAIPVLIGWILTGMGNSVGYLYVARFLFGFSYGAAYPVVPIYLGEMASDAVRGAYGTMITLMAKKAILVMYTIGPYLEFRELAWVSMTSAAVFVFSFMWMPETPYFLIGKNKNELAEKSLAWFRQSSDVSAELEVMRSSVEKSNQEDTSFKELFSPAYYNNMRIVFVLIFNMQFTGILAVHGYAQIIFEKISTSLTPEEMSIVLGVVQMIAVVFPVFLVDRMGRRPLLLISATGTTTGLLICTIYFAAAGDNYQGSLGWIAFVSLLFYIISYGVGLATVPFAILTEIFPKNIRSYAASAVTVVSAIVIFVIVKLFQISLETVGAYLPFGVFAVCGAIGLALIYIYIPETKGRSLEEVQRIVTGLSTKL
ncbi:facilitated trehalose transporter Tret1-like [Aedes albopictus]|uniref:Major facilitator superfamily (MFS) profile domain-containing protein n=1 Tax=Aedes albopictus TaxID=7160 RepID=A0ABM1ZRR3_AEDAL